MEPSNLSPQLYHPLQSRVEYIGPEAVALPLVFAKMVINS